MPQLFFPFFPSGMTLINSNIGFEKRDGKVFYFCGNMPVFSHSENDRASFRMFTSQLYVNGNATQAEIVRAFGVSKESVKRSVKLFREKGSAGFFAQRETRGPSVLIPEVLSDIQDRLDQGQNVAVIAKELGLKKNTLQKAVLDGRLHQKKRLLTHR